MKRDGRGLAHETLDAMRFIALERMAEGESPAAVSASFGLHRTWAYKVRAKARGRGKGARAVRDCVAALHGKLTLHFLPGYAPEPNPDELAWSHPSAPATLAGRCARVNIWRIASSPNSPIWRRAPT